MRHLRNLAHRMAAVGYGGDSVSVPTSDPATLRQQVGSLPPYILAAWRNRYVPVDGVDLEARALINQEAAVIRAQGSQPDALAVWVRLTDLLVKVGSPSPELLAAAALAGLAGGLRPQGFDIPDAAKPPTAEAD